MRKLLTCTTALTVALGSFHTLPARAQTMLEDGSVVGPDGTVLCVPTADAPCDLDAIIQALAEQEAAEAEAQAAADAAAAEAAAAEAAAAEAAAAEAAAAEAAAAEAAAAEAAAAEAAAQAAAEAAAAEAEAQAAADAAAAEAEAQAAAEAAAAEAEAQAAADAAAAQAAAEAAAAEAAAQAAADAAAADAAAQAAAEAAAAEAAAQAAADAAAAEAAAQAAADAAAAEAAAQAAAEAAAQSSGADADAEAQAAAEAAAAEAAAQAQAAAEAAAAAEAQAAADAAAAEAAAQAATDAAAAEAAAQAEADAATSGADTATVDPQPEPPAETPAEPPVVTEIIATDEPVDIPVPEPEAVESLAEILSTPETEVPASGDEAVVDTDTAPPLELTLPAAAVVAEAISDSGQPADPATAPAPADGSEVPTAPLPESPVAIVTEVISSGTTRTSDEDFIDAPVAVGDGQQSGLSDLEKVGLIALGALVVGVIINEGRDDQKEVVTNSGDRVIVLNPDGTYDIYKDDDAVLRRPGVRTVTETYRDGSTRTVVQRADGTQVVTVRDASGRVLRRSYYDVYGVETVLIDDLYIEEPIIISELPPPRRDRVTISTSDTDAALKAELAAIEADEIGRKFSLRQIREIPEVRALAATIEVDSITFDSGSPAIRATEAQKLADLGRLMQTLLDANPAHVFLIEGHTDAVGSAPSNLLLSDRRAESLALALTEYFDIPPENLVIQGYGESELKIDTDGDERANRRVVVRLITPLMRTPEVR